MLSCASRLVPLAALLAVGILPAQLRKPCFVTVVGGDDRPLADAEVTMAWSPGQGTPGTFDVVRARTDERGRCRPALIVGRLYTAWAIGAARVDGTRLVSEPTDHGASGVVMELLAMHAWRPRELKVENAGEWGGVGAMRLLALPCGGHQGLAEPLATAAQRVDLPPAPWCTTFVGLHDDAGVLLQVRSIAPDEAAPALAFARPPTAHLLVTDAKGDPAVDVVASVSLLGFGSPSDSLFSNRYSFGFRALARGDAAGSVAVPMHVQDIRRDSQWISVIAKDCAPTYLPGAEVSATSATQPLSLKLVAAQQVTGRLRGRRPGEAAAAQMVVTTGRTLPRIHYEIAVPLDVDFVGEEMRMQVPAAVSEHQFVLHLTPGDEKALPRCVILPPGSGSFDHLPDLDLTKLRAFPLRILDAEGAPAGGAEVGVMAIRDGRDPGGDRLCTHLAADLAGRAELVLGDGMWGIYAGNGIAHGLEFLAPDRQGGEITLQLVAIPTLRCRVVDGEGKPVRGASVEPAGGPGGFSGVLRGAEGWAKEAIAVRVAGPLTARPRSDGDGVLVVPVQDWRPWRATYRVRAQGRVSETFAIKPGVDLGDVVVR